MGERKLVKKRWKIPHFYYVTCITFDTILIQFGLCPIFLQMVKVSVPFSIFMMAYCKIKPSRSSGQQDLSVHTDAHTDILLFFIGKLAVKPSLYQQ